MVTKEQHLVNIKQDKVLELETQFNNIVNGGKYFDLTLLDSSVSSVYVAGGRDALGGLQGLYQYYADNSISACDIRDASSKVVYTTTLENLGTFVTEIRDWGMESYLNNIRKQDYVNNCTTVEDVLDVTWDSVES